MMDNYYTKYRYFSCFEMTEDNESWWIPEYRRNTLFKISKATLEIQKTVDLIEGTEDSEGCYSYIVVYQDKLIFLPQNSLHIALYDKKSDRLTVIALNTGKEGGSYGTAGYVRQGKYIYVFSSYKECMPFVLDGETGNIRYLESWKEQIHKYGQSEKWIINSVVEMNRTIFLGLYGKNLILKYIPEQDCYEELLLPDEHFRINKIYKDTDCGKIVVLSVESGIIELLCENRKLFETNRWFSEMGESEVINILLNQDKIVIIPKTGRHIEIIDRKLDEFWGIDIPKEYLLSLCGFSDKFFHSGKIDKKFIYLYPFSAKGIICIHMDLKKAELIEMEVNRAVLEEQYKIYVLQNEEGKMYVERKLPLNIFFNICGQNDAINRKNDQSVGTNIFRCIEEGKN